MRIIRVSLPVIVFFAGCAAVFAQESAPHITTQKVVVEDSATAPSGGYLEGGTSIYGVDEKVVEADTSPVTELKMLRTRYSRELKRSERLEEENQMLQRKLNEFDTLLKRKDMEIEDYKKKTMEAQYHAVGMEQKYLELKIAILRKKLIRESQYPPYYEVKKNESLWKIAGYRTLYDNCYKWTEIFYANQDKIVDPDYIYPGTVLKIPRPEMDYEDWTITGLDLDSLKGKLIEKYKDDPKLKPIIEKGIDVLEKGVKTKGPQTDKSTGESSSDKSADDKQSAGEKTTSDEDEPLEEDMTNE